MARYFLQTSPGLLAILMRHGSTAANNSSNPKVRGWMDNQLSNKGKMEVQLTANRLAKYRPQYIVSSDFMRDSETAEIVAGVLNISNRDVSFDARTWDVGDFSGKSEKQVNDAIIDIYKNPWETPPGSSESFNEFQSRWLRFLDGTLDYAANVFRPAVIVTHGRNIALTQSYITGVETWDADMPMPAGYAALRVEPDRSLNITFESPTEKVFEDV